MLTDSRVGRVLSELARVASPEGVIALSGARLAALLGSHGVGSRTAWVRLRDRLVSLGALEVAQGGGDSVSNIRLTAKGREAARPDRFGQVPDSPPDRSGGRAVKPFGIEEKESSPLSPPQPPRTGRPDRFEELVIEVRSLRLALVDVTAKLALIVATLAAPSAPIVHRDLKPENVPPAAVAAVALAAQPSPAAPSPRETRPQEETTRRRVLWDPQGSTEGRRVMGLVEALKLRDPPKPGKRSNPMHACCYALERVARALNHALLAKACGEADSEAAIFWASVDNPGFEFYEESSCERARVEELAKEWAARVAVGRRDAKPANAPAVPKLIDYSAALREAKGT